MEKNTGLFNELSNLRTERINQNTRNIDLCDTTEILNLINNEDISVPLAVQNEIPHISEAVDLIVSAFKKGGRLFYVGAGTSGRLGIVDASECPPTFGTNPEMVQGIIAGGNEAMFKAVEGAEDSFKGGASAISDKNLSNIDIVCGIAASGRTPYVLGALNEAQYIGCKTIFITTSSRDYISTLQINPDVVIAPDVGAEVIAGSTRMKSGTAQKLILNMLTTASMIRLGKTYGNVMVDLQLTNAKLKERAKKIVMNITVSDYDTASHYLEKANGNVKIALVMILTNSNLEQANSLLNKADGFIRKIIDIDD